MYSPDKRIPSYTVRDRLTGIQHILNDIQNSIAGVNALYRTTGDPQLAQVKSELQNIMSRLEQVKSRMSAKRAEGYAIYYFAGIDYYPASSRYGTNDIYTVPEQAIQVAGKLSQEYPGVEFGVYPIDYNYEIIGQPVKKFRRQA